MTFWIAIKIIISGEDQEEGVRDVGLCESGKCPYVSQMPKCVDMPGIFKSTIVANDRYIRHSIL